MDSQSTRANKFTLSDLRSRRACAILSRAAWIMTGSRSGDSGDGALAPPFVAAAAEAGGELAGSYNRLSSAALRSAQLFLLDVLVTGGDDAAGGDTTVAAAIAARADAGSAGGGGLGDDDVVD